MNASSIFTRTRFGLDTRVWAFLTVALLLSGALLGFRIATSEQCSDFALTIVNAGKPDATTYYINDQLTFTAKVKGDDVLWEFGDNGVAKGARVVHNYTHSGTFYITATLNGKCRQLATVIIRPQDILSAPASSGEAMINGPDAPKAGVPVTFYTNANGQTYEWNVLNSPNYETQRIAVATYTFTTEGPKTIELKVDGKILRKDIQVLAADNKPPEQLPQQPLPVQNQDPLPTAPVAPKAKIIPPEEFTDMLKKVAKGDMNAASFDPYLCEGGSAGLRVLLNDKNWSTLSAFCDKIFKNKKYNIKNTEVIRDDNGCVKQLKISYCKWIVLGLKCKEE